MQMKVTLMEGEPKGIGIYCDENYTEPGLYYWPEETGLVVAYHVQGDSKLYKIGTVLPEEDLSKYFSEDAVGAATEAEGAAPEVQSTHQGNLSEGFILRLVALAQDPQLAKALIGK